MTERQREIERQIKRIERQLFVKQTLPRLVAFMIPTVFFTCLYFWNEVAFRISLALMTAIGPIALLWVSRR